MKNIIIIGSGNVATHIAQHLHQLNFNIIQVYSRNLENAKSLAKQVDAEPITELNKLNELADLYVISVTDNAINTVLSQLNFQPKLIVHTAGSIAMDALNQFNNYGVFYPLQSFSKNRPLEFSTIPFCIEANSLENKNKLLQLANSISNNVLSLSSEQRKQCHLAAVFANNFTNHLYAIAEKILSEKNIPFDVLKPLILETAQKAQVLSPILAQTGPAVRNNSEVIENHIGQLSSPELEKLYSFVSNSIIAFHNKK